MASIALATLKDGRRRYRVRVRIGGRYRSTTMPNRAEARRWAEQVERSFTLSRRTPLGQSELVSFGELVDKYERQVMRYKKRHTRRQQLQQLQWWEQYFGKGLRLVEITPPRISAAKEALDPLSPATINRYLAVLSHLFTKAVKEWRCMEVNPARDVERLPEPKGRTRWLKPIERRDLLFACSTSANRMLYTIATVALSTGARKGEILGMRWDKLDLDRTMTVAGKVIPVGRYFLEETKTDEARQMILFGEALESMRKLRTERKPGAIWCFPSPRDATRPIDFRTAWERALDKAGIENFCFHDLRHSAASYLGEQGASLAQIGAILGHKNQATTKKYTHFTSSGTEHLVARMNSRLFRGATL